MADSEPADQDPLVRQSFDWVPSRDDPSVLLPSMILETRAEDGSVEPRILSWSDPKDCRTMLFLHSWGVQSGDRVQILELSREDLSEEHMESIGVRLGSVELEPDPSASRLEVFSRF